MSAHTPGSWAVEQIPPDAHRDPDVNIPDEAGHWIVDPAVAGEVLALVLKTSRGEAEANARLMAAAPELLEALKHAKEWLDEEGCDCGNDEPGTCALCLTNAAIAKAEGRS